MLDNDTQLLVAIFQKTFNHDGFARDPVKYVKKYKTQIQIAGQLFAYLDLAQPDPQSPLGWKPTRLLLEIIAERAVRRSRPVDRFVCAEEGHIFSLLCDAAFGAGSGTQQRVYKSGLGFEVLQRLGMIRESTGGDLLPTLHLRELFADAYYDRRPE